MILKQRNIGKFIGMLYITVGQVSPYINWVSLALVGVMSYYTTFNPMFASWGIQLPFWIFIVCMVVIVVILLMVAWVFLLPSYMSAVNVQVWEHENPQRELLQKMEKEIETHTIMIQELKAMIQELKK